MHPRTPALAVLLAACPQDVPQTTPATAESGAATETSDTTDAGSGSVSAPGLTTAVDDPTTSSTSGDTTDASTGEPPAVTCPATLPAPTNCDPVPAVCGNATPIAGTPDSYVSGVALTADHVWFRYTGPSVGCYSGFYRVAKRGGDAQFVRTVERLVGYEADDEAVYLIEGTDDVYTHTVTALVGDGELLLGVLHGDPESNDPWYPQFARTRGGVVIHVTGGVTPPSFYLLTPTELSVLASEVPGARLGSLPAYDGERLYFTWSDPTFDPEPESPLDRRLVTLVGDTSIILADDAASSFHATVAVDATHVYFATGQFSEDDPQPMGVAKVPTAGGAVTPLFPTSLRRVDQVLVDDAAVYYRDDPADIFAVPLAGGTPRHLWHGEIDDDNNSLHIRQDTHDLYFAVEAPIHGDVPAPGENFIVRVAKAAEIP